MEANYFLIFFTFEEIIITVICGLTTHTQFKISKARFVVEVPYLTDYQLYTAVNKFVVSN